MWRNGRLFGRVPLRSDPDGVAFALGGGVYGNPTAESKRLG